MGKKGPRMTRINADYVFSMRHSNGFSLNSIRGIRIIRGLLFIVFSLAVLSRQASAELPTPTLPSPFVAVDLKVGESEEVALPNGQKVAVKLVDVKDYRDSLRG